MILTQDEFLALSGQEKADFVNKFIVEGVLLEDIARQNFNKGRSWLSKRLNAEGFFNPSGKGYRYDAEKHVAHKEEQHPREVELPEGLQELLKYKDKLIALATAETLQTTNKPGISIIAKYDGEESISRSFKLPKSLSDELDILGAKLRIKKQDLCTLAIAYFVEQYTEE